jgi:hypothetical protein
MQPKLLVECASSVAGLQTLGGLDQSRTDLFLRSKRVDRDPQVAHRPFWLGIAAGEGKADTAGTARLFQGRSRSGGLQYGGEALPIKRLSRKGRVDDAVAQRRRVRSAIGRWASCSTWAGIASG